MKYYKIIRDNEFIGAVNSQDFVRYQVKHHFYERVNENYGEFAEYKGVFYRSTWMQPLREDAPEYIEASVIEITENEYKAYMAAIAANQPISAVDEDVEEVESDYVDPIDQMSLEFIRESKLKEMSNTCHHLIEAGFDITLTDGQTHHFSLDTQDQLNLITLSAMAETEEVVPYHADGEVCRFYTAAEMKQIIAAATQFKIYHTTYYNALKQYINALNNFDTIAGIYYGIELPEEYQSDVLKAII